MNDTTIKYESLTFDLNVKVESAQVTTTDAGVENDTAVPNTWANRTLANATSGTAVTNAGRSADFDGKEITSITWTVTSPGGGA